eukprot:PLAT14273.1.p1 GENE.PLAT14273.1~~PLAT14273.1.p1  ORF type:complete len:231 (-),score=38.36 PLAT14273.1:44-736(-)
MTMVARSLLLVAVVGTLLVAPAAAGLSCAALSGDRTCSGRPRLIGYFGSTDLCERACELHEDGACCLWEHYACYLSPLSYSSGGAHAGPCTPNEGAPAPPMYPTHAELLVICRPYCLQANNFGSCMAKCFAMKGEMPPGGGSDNSNSYGAQTAGKKRSGGSTAGSNQFSPARFAYFQGKAADDKAADSTTEASASPLVTVNSALAASAGVLFVALIVLVAKVVRSRRSDE